MKILTRLLTVLVFAGWAGVVSALPINVLIEVDITDLSAVTFSATGAAPSINGSGQNTLTGISLLGIFSSAETVNPGATGSLLPHGATLSYNNAWTLPSDLDLNFWCSGSCNETQDFDTTFAAFTGIATVDLTGYSILGAGSYGNILDEDGFIGNGVIIGQWEIIDSRVPLPSTLALFGLGLAGLGFARRKKA